MESEVLKFYFWEPFPRIEKGFIYEEVVCRGGIVWDDSSQASIIFVYVYMDPAIIGRIRKDNKQAVIVALVGRSNGSSFKKRCFNAGANMVFYTCLNAQGFKAIFRRLYAQL